jgi:nitrite reductase/ring-hydroxylating ferredoxin subunit/multimeric flavodoxin WrbA
MADAEWVDLGPVEDLSKQTVRQLRAGRTPLAVAFRDGAFSVVSGACNHVGGPLGEGRLEGDYLVCPWHGWKFHRRTGHGEPGFEDDRVPAYVSKVEGGHLWVDLASATARRKRPHPPHPLAREPVRAPGETRVAGLSTTAMDLASPRFSGSDHLLDLALARARDTGCETNVLRLAELRFRACEGYYSKSARACTWPCSITEMDPHDEMQRVYEALVHWADVVLVATPIRWGAASSLYFRMAERLNCVQNQITTHDRVLVRDKVAAFIVVGGQDNVQAVAGQMLGFFAELGFLFPQFPYVAHSRGWSAEDMERNVAEVRGSAELADGVRALVDRAVEASRRLRHAAGRGAGHVARGGRKAHRLGPVSRGDRE